MFLLSANQSCTNWGWGGWVEAGEWSVLHYHTDIFNIFRKIQDTAIFGEQHILYHQEETRKYFSSVRTHTQERRKALQSEMPFHICSFALPWVFS